MKTLSGGRLLDRVAYCMKQPCKGTNILDEAIQVRDTFPYNPESKTAGGTASRWAEPGYYDKNKKYVPEVITRDNTPFSITITDLHVRSEGGRAYKVIDADNRRFDLREDQVMEVLRDVGIQPAGVVPAQFVWGILGSQIRLVLVGGDLHKSMIDGANDKKAFEQAQASGTAPTESTLQAGHVYRKKDKTPHLFLGRVKHSLTAKPVFAFMAMPHSEERDADDLDQFEDSPHCSKRWLEARRRENKTYANWETLTWPQRCQFAWIDRWLPETPPGEEAHTAYPDIVFMSSPKFEADVGSVDVGFLEMLRANEKQHFDYTNALRNSILSEAFKKAHPDVPGYLAVGDAWVSYGHRKADDAAMTRAWRQMKSDFLASIEWF